MVFSRGPFISNLLSITSSMVSFPGLAGLLIRFHYVLSNLRLVHILRTLLVSNLYHIGQVNFPFLIASVLFHTYIVLSAFVFLG